MDKNDLKVGGLITIKDNIKYRILEIFDEDGINYLFCCTNKKPILPVIFQYRNYDGKIQIKEENDEKILKKIYTRIYEENRKK
jgi:hypothetical protein